MSMTVPLYGFGQGAGAAREQFLYNKGDECTDLTGGWVGKNWVASWAPNPGTFTKNSNSITIANGNQQNIKAQTVNKIDFTNAETLYLNVPGYTGTSGAAITLLSDPEQSAIGGNHPVRKEINAAKLYAIDVSQVTGEYYVAIGMGSYDQPGSVTFDEVYTK